MDKEFSEIVLSKYFAPARRRRQRLRFSMWHLVVMAYRIKGTQTASSCAGLFFVEPAGRAICMVARAQHRSIRIDSDNSQLFASQCINDYALLRAFYTSITTVVHCAQLTADGRHHVHSS